MSVKIVKSLKLKVKSSMLKAESLNLARTANANPGILVPQQG
jgi:hypothetical protein